MMKAIRGPAAFAFPLPALLSSAVTALMGGRLEELQAKTRSPANAQAIALVTVVLRQEDVADSE
jgi:hypothetical protein